jgi:hypothetical protein
MHFLVLVYRRSSAVHVLSGGGATEVLLVTYSTKLVDAFERMF